MKWFWFPLGAFAVLVVCFALRLPKVGVLLTVVGLFGLYDAIQRS